tara:strand:+ start:16926 stop:18995 length:2070 start_codon:yes stop_codon:yes gene_type:complete
MSNSSVRNVVRYNCQSLFLGPSPETGYHFISYTGELNNDSSELIKNHNLLKEITRVQDFGYSISFNRTDITQLGIKGLLARPNINYPQVELNFSYLPNGLRNEARLGFHVNYGQFEYPHTGKAFYKKNDQVCLLSGFDTRSLAYVDYTGVGNVWPEVGTSAGGSGAMAGADRFWPPYIYRDRRNIYAIITDGDSGDQDAHQKPLREIFNVDDTVQQIDPNSASHNLISFGDCYLSRYSVTAQVGDVMRANVAYVAENVEFHSGASGKCIPALNLKTGSTFVDVAADGFIARPEATSSAYTYFKNTQNGNPLYFPPGNYTLSHYSGSYFAYDSGDSRFNNFGGSGDNVGIDVRFTNASEFGYVDSVYKDVSQSAGHSKTIISGMGHALSGYNSGNLPSDTTIVHGGGKIGVRVSDLNRGATPVPTGFEGASATGPYTLGDGILAYKLTAPDDICTRMVTPLEFPDEGPTAFRQGDLTMKVPNDISGMGVDFDDAHIQSFTIDLDLNRDMMDSLSYKHPVYRGVNFPVFANLNFITIVKDSTTGSLCDTMKRNDNYDFQIKVKNSCDVNFSSKGSVVTGMANPHQAGTLPLHQDLDNIVYEFKKAKFLGANFTSSIGGFKRGDFNFAVEIDPDDLSKGLFISGLLNVEKIEDFFLMEGNSSGGDQNGGFLQREGGNAQDKSLLVTNLNPLY